VVISPPLHPESQESGSDESHWRITTAVEDGELKD